MAHLKDLTRDTCVSKVVVVNKTEIKKGTTVQIPVSFGYITDNGKGKRERTGTVEATFIEYKGIEKEYAYITYNGVLFLVSVGQILVR